MARTKIDYGIDLGTTNSAIARMENGKSVIKKTDQLKDTMPSCINFNKKQSISAGDSALNALRYDKLRAIKNPSTDFSNTFIEFKRLMGTDKKYHSSFMNKDFSSEELSSEVLKKLKSFVTRKKPRQCKFICKVFKGTMNLNFVQVSVKYFVVCIILNL